MSPVIISVQHLRITGLQSLVLWSNLPLLMGMVLHLLRLSSGLQLTETNSSVLTSCDISSESFALSLGEAVFSLASGLSVRTRPHSMMLPEEAYQHAFTSVLQPCWQDDSQFRLHLNCSRWKYFRTVGYSLF